ncbi:hypothetical protein ACP70R_020864 [Stipagrostis hirtigluma subsp. patula]
MLINPLVGAERCCGLAAARRKNASSALSSPSPTSFS